MSRRAHQKNTEADLQLHACLNATPPKSFLMIAGAGSGKTTSLIKALSEILDKHGETLSLHRQKVACITYTEIAAAEIWADVGNSPIIHVSTIHSFLWSLIRAFQIDIRDWVKNRIQEKLDNSNLKAGSFGQRVQQKTRDKNQKDIFRYTEQLGKIDSVSVFSYGTGSDYENGILGHDDILKMVPQLISERQLLRRIISQQYPYIFVDESQDTSDNVVLALKSVVGEFGDQSCLGFFGDPMQRIYPTGIGDIPLEAGWEKITKPENFRCPTSVLNVANAIRHDGDGLVQTRGRMTGPDNALVSIPGTANIFILPIDNNRSEHLVNVRRWAARSNDDPLWETDQIKQLVVVHRMAANRLGFGDLYAALNDKSPEKFKNGFIDGTAWPLRPFTNFVIPIVSAVKENNEFEVMQILRKHSPLLKRECLREINVAERLASIHSNIEQISQMMEPASDSTNADVLLLLHSSGLISIDERLLSYLEVPAQDGGAPNPESQDEDDGEEITQEARAMEAFLACHVSQFWGYQKYFDDLSPFATQQGVKGAEFERVLVVLDDDEGTHVQFSYDKYLGIKSLSAHDLENMRNGKETAIDRTRRLFYVCCTRALKDLAVVLFTQQENLELAKQQILSLGLFPEECIHFQSV